MFASQQKGYEHFTKADFISLGWADQGITWETDPVKHRQKVKWLSPAFSSKSLRSKEPIIHKYIDIFVEKMKRIGSRKEGIELRQVSAHSVSRERLHSYSFFFSGQTGWPWILQPIWDIVER
jgi:hypothetical protein